MRGGRTNLLGIVPGGSSVPILNAEECDRALLDFDSLKDLNSGLGTVRLGSGASASPVASATRARGVNFGQLLIRSQGAVIVMDQSTDIVAAISRFAKCVRAALARADRAGATSTRAAANALPAARGLPGWVRASAGELDCEDSLRALAVHVPEPR